MALEAANAGWAVYELPTVEEGRAEPATAPQDAPVDDRLLLQNVVWFCSLRWLVVGTLAGLGVLGWATAGHALPGGIRLSAGWPLTVAAALAVLNLSYLDLARRAARKAQPAALRLQSLWLQIILDLAMLTVVIHYVGSLGTFAPFMYLFHIVLACIFFPYAQSLLVTLCAMGMYLACILLEQSGIAPPQSLLAAGPPAGGSLGGVLAWHFGSLVFISGTVWYLASWLANALRRRDEELAEINRRLVAATEERARYMIRTTHQLKAPFAAIHANAQLLLGGYCGPIPEAAATIVEHIAARCEMLSREIKDMLQLANLRSAAQDPPPPVEIDLAELIGSCLANLRPQATKRGIAVEYEIISAPVKAVQDHAVMMLDNAISNAVNYSRDGRRVWISCKPKPNGGAAVVVRDEGIGIPADRLPHIFDDYFRTAEAVQHNKASTGLGLAILRQAALAGRVGVRVESAPAQGTAFFLDFPPSPDAPEKVN
jgi:signal transduction histidine kinase